MKVDELVVIVSIFLLWILYDMLRNYKRSKQFSFLNVFNNIIILILVTMVLLMRPIDNSLEYNYILCLLVIIPIAALQYFEIIKLNQPERMRKIIVKSLIILTSIYVYFSL